jgi:predicted permease
VLWSRLRALFLRSHDEDLLQELGAHCEEATDEYIRQGLPPAEARQAALRSFGGMAQAHDAYRDVRSWAWLRNVGQDVRYGLRTFRRSSGFTTVAVLTLALGIGVNAAVFTITNGVLFSGFPHVDPANRIVYIGTNAHGAAGVVSYPDVEDWRTQATSFGGLVGVVLSGGARTRIIDQRRPAETYDMSQVSANVFRVLGQAPILGRDFAPDDERLGAMPALMLSYGLWERRYAKDPTVVGQTVRINSTPSSWGAVDSLSGIPATVIGVMPPGFDFPHHRVDLWLPLTPVPGLPFPDLRDRGNRRFWFVVGRLADGVTVQRARAELESLGRRLEQVYPLSNRGVIPVVRTFDQFWIGPNAVALYASMWGAVAFVLLIACANLANLLLARASSRSREIAVRIALGAGRWHVLRQVLVESLMLSAAGCLCGWVIAEWSVRAYNRVSSPPHSYNHWDYAMDHRVAAYLVAISIGTGLLFGIVPAMRLSRLDICAKLKDGGQGAAGGARSGRASSLLVAGEMALAVVLLVGAGVMIRSVATVATADLGANTGNVLTAPIGLPRGTYPTAQARIAVVGQLTSHVQAMPGVESVALATALPAGFDLSSPPSPYELEGGGGPLEAQRRPTVANLTISSAYFQTLRVPLRLGRGFTDADTSAGLPVAVVNDRFARTAWPGADPLGKRFRFFRGATPEPWVTVVGVVSNVVHDDWSAQRFDPVIYRPFQQQPATSFFLLARTFVPPMSLARVFQREVRAVDADLLVGQGGDMMIESLDARLTENYWSTSVNGILFLLFAAIALLLASVGLYAVAAHGVSQRTQEIGIRSAMGATARHLLGMVLVEGMLPVGIGLGIGLPAATVVTPALRSQLVKVLPTDPVTLGVASGVLILSALLGCWIPARRAIRVDPMVALRYE